jgi:hypothetical protein
LSDAFYKYVAFCRFGGAFDEHDERILVEEKNDFSAKGSGRETLYAHEFVDSVEANLGRMCGTTIIGA